MKGSRSSCLVSFEASIALLCVLDLLQPFPPEVGLFGTDVTTDWINGVNLIKNGDVIWGAIMVALPFTPMALVGIPLVVIALLQPVWAGLGVLEDWLKNCHWLAKIVVGFLGGCLYVLLALALALVLYLPGVVIGTAGYMLFVLGSGCLKVVKPELESLKDDYKVLPGVEAEIFKELPPMLRMAEVATESYPQSILGEFDCSMSRFPKIEPIPLPRHLHPADNRTPKGPQCPDHPVRRDRGQSSLHHQGLR